MASSSTKRFPVNASGYELFEEVGEGVSASVYKARCIALNETVAIKILDLERCRNDMDTIRKEVHTMSLIDHPNLLKAHCSFMDGSSLWIVMPYMSAGSCFHIMKSAHLEGFEQPIIATLLREVLKALVYLHGQGHIHRDVKAGNILVDSKGAVKLGDFGVSACMFDCGERKRTRNTFVGTPCWMAPEVMQQVDGYDFKADIWSFGITALELAHGHAPFSKYPPMKVLLMTLQNAPPRLDYERDKKFSKSFRELVAACLVKDPKKRPTSAKLLKHPFFKHARSSEYLSRKILDSLSPLGDRFRQLKEKEAELFLQNRGINGDKEQLSQQEYMRGISAWNFDLEDLKKQAALILGDEICSSEIQDLSCNQDFDNTPVLRGNPQVERSNTFPLERSKDSETATVTSPRDVINGTNNQPVEMLSPSSPFQFLQSPGENNACRSGEGAVERPGSLGQIMSAGDKRTRNTGSDPDEPKNGFASTSGKAWNRVTRTAGSVLPLLQNLLYQNNIQREKVTRLIRYIEGAAGNGNCCTEHGFNTEGVLGMKRGEACRGPAATKSIKWSVRRTDAQFEEQQQLQQSSGGGSLFPCTIKAPLLLSLPNFFLKKNYSHFSIFIFLYFKPFVLNPVFYFSHRKKRGVGHSIFKK
ncbi:PREDICTED: serine/threonine-protein kinase BLUS1 isoform X2 [Tarenaya hassleriana]|uniref:serine/threonine-protein kinase BLUS1 isoform X2 n=1 Tax=Tarenaya hassleriana TaxID=28532 RepID=UPI00053C4C0C|nr:PREDICTED: serine/threonine-protein kinase BLUS1 isoform X2 [Tarenaya hassleriana]